MDAYCTMCVYKRNVARLMMSKDRGRGGRGVYLIQLCFVVLGDDRCRLLWGVNAKTVDEPKGLFERFRVVIDVIGAFAVRRARASGVLHSSPSTAKGDVEDETLGSEEFVEVALVLWGGGKVGNLLSECSLVQVVGGVTNDIGNLVAVGTGVEPHGYATGVASHNVPSSANVVETGAESRVCVWGEDAAASRTITFVLVLFAPELHTGLFGSVGGKVALRVVGCMHSHLVIAVVADTFDNVDLAGSGPFLAVAKCPECGPDCTPFRHVQDVDDDNRVVPHLVGRNSDTVATERTRLDLVGGIGGNSKLIAVGPCKALSNSSLLVDVTFVSKSTCIQLTLYDLE